MKQYSVCPSWAAWLTGDATDAARTALKRVQAAHLLGSSLRQLSSLHASKKNGAAGALAAEQALRAALVALQVGGRLRGGFHQGATWGCAAGGGRRAEQV